MKCTYNPVSDIFVDQVQNINVSRNSYWANSMKTLLDNLGFSNIWNDFDINSNYMPMFKQRLRDQYKEWHTAIASK